MLTVKQSTDPAAAKDYFARLRPTLGDTSTLAGLGEASYGTAAGKVVVVKDNATLMVDATAQPAVLGAYQAKRADFAYQVAAVILACWIGHECRRSTWPAVKRQRAGPPCPAAGIASRPVLVAACR